MVRTNWCQRFVLRLLARLLVPTVALLACQSFAISSAHAGGGRRPHKSTAAKVECKQSAERAQQLRMDGKLLDSRDELHACLKPACPALVRSYCTRWFEEVEAALPTVVIKVRDPQGNDLSDVQVVVDGAPNDDWKEGLALSMDPGEHQLGFHRVGSESQTVKVILAAGEKNRLVAVTLVPNRPLDANEWDEVAEGETPSVQAEDVPGREPNRMRRAAWATLSVSVASLGAFAALGAIGNRDLDNLRSQCEGQCPSDLVDSAWTKLVVADVALGLAVASAGVSTWLFVASRDKRADREPPSTSVSLTPSEHGLFGSFRTRF